MYKALVFLSFCFFSYWDMSAIVNSCFHGAEDVIRLLDKEVKCYINEHHYKVTVEYHYISNNLREDGLTRGK